jgi:hypothetical protein
MLKLIPVLMFMLLITGCAAADADLPTPTIGNIIALKPNQCMPTRILGPLLSQEYGEKLMASGVLQAANIPLIMMLFTSKAGSWTVTTTSQEGLTCVLIWGENYKVNAPPGEKI